MRSDDIIREFRVAHKNGHHHAVKVKMILLWDHLSVLKNLFFRLTIAQQPVDQICFCLSSILILALPADAHCLFLSLSLTFSLPLSFSPSPSTSWFSLSSSRQGGKCQSFQVICDLGLWWDWWIAAPGSVLHCQPNNLWFITPETSEECMKTQNRKMMIWTEKRDMQKRQHAVDGDREECRNWDQNRWH